MYAYLCWTYQHQLMWGLNKADPSISMAASCKSEALQSVYGDIIHGSSPGKHLLFKHVTTVRHHECVSQRVWACVWCVCVCVFGGCIVFHWMLLKSVCVLSICHMKQTRTTFTCLYMHALVHTHTHAYTHTHTHTHTQTHMHTDTHAHIHVHTHGHTHTHTLL